MILVDFLLRICNGPRYSMNGLMLEGSAPDIFRQHTQDALHRIDRKPGEHRLVFLTSWSECAAGNHVEPDFRFGHGYFKALRSELGEPETVQELFTISEVARASVGQIGCVEG